MGRFLKEEIPMGQHLLEWHQAMCQLLLGGVFDRHPDFKVPPQPKSPPWVKPFVKVADPAALTLPDATALVN